MASKTSDKKVDNTRDLAPMTDPIAYRESYDPNNIVGWASNWSDLIVHQDWITNWTNNPYLIAEGREKDYLNYITNGWKNIPNWWGETAGSTVSQNNQSNTQNQNGTTTNWYDWTDGKWHITVWPQNANVNYYQYWDDSNPHQQWQKWWMNEKYTWEWVSNSYIEYNPDITLADLDPNYLYWENARQQNRKEAGYIARRNDMIASALYNEWKVSREDVANFLSQQNEWMNSTEADRLNTIESVWKRLWQIAPEQPEVDLSKAEDIVKDTSGKIYWKTTAEEWNPKAWIDTLADKNSVLTAMQEGRVQSVQDFVSQDYRNIAECIRSWATYWSEQTWRDAQQYYPDFIAAVNAEVKRLRTQENVQAIASGWKMTTVADKVDTNTELTSYAVNNATSSTSATQLLKGIDSILESNDTAKSAQELMGSIEKDMATLKNRMQNLREEANKAFKWDVPDYMVNAYINNKSQEIQNQLSILEDRYNAAYNRYKTEVSNAQWEKEYELKERQVKIQEASQSLDEWKAKNGVTSSSSTSGWTWSAKMRTERNNNPTAMTTDVAKMLWGELGVDYEIWDAFVTASWQTLYTAKLIGDPIETTIRLIDRWIANGIDPFYRANWQWRWSYISSIWITKDKWVKMSPAEKADVIAKMLKHEWGSMENMLYYVENNDGWGEWNWWDGTYNPQDDAIYAKYLSWNYTKPWLETQTTAKWKTVSEFDAEAHAWKNAQDEETQKRLESKPSSWTRKDWASFSMEDTPTFDTLTYDQQNIVYQLLNLNKNPNTLNKRQYWDDFEKILSAVKEINPLWSDAQYWEADKVRKEWNTSTKNGSNSRNWTAIATAKDIYDIAWEFGNAKWTDWNGMLNFLRSRLSDEAYTKLLLNLEVLASEYAWALKGNNAAPTEQEIADKKEILAANLGAGAMQTAAKEVAKTLFNKNANEAVNYANVTLEKPPLIVTQEVADWMYDTVGIKEMTEFYDYTPSPSVQPPKKLNVGTNGYKWKSISEALNQTSQPKNNNELKDFTKNRLKK